MNELLWRGVCYHIAIKDFSPKQASFYKYIWEVIIYRVMTGKRHLGPDIWLETPNQGTGTEDMIRTI